MVGLGLLLLAALWMVARRRAGDLDLDETPFEGSEFMIRLPAPGLLGRCLSVEDIQYAASLPSQAVLRLLLRERRRLVLAWLRQTRHQAGRLFHLHVRGVRDAADLRPGAELVLLFHFGLFLLVYQILLAVVWLYGPLRTQVFVRSVRSVAELLAGLGGRIADRIAPTSVGATATAAGRPL